MRFFLIILFTTVAFAQINWEKSTVYHVLIDRFAVASKQPPEIKSGFDFRGGTIKGLIENLDYIKSLGADTLLLNPIFKGDSPHGYAVTDHFSVDPRIGTNEDFRTLVKEAHKRDMKVIFDLVLNHMSGNAELFKEKPHWFRGPTLEKAWNDSLITSVWSRLNFYLFHDLKQEDEDVYKYLLSVARFWAEYDIDGFRMDAVTLIEPKFWGRFNRDIRKFVTSDFIILGELFSTHLSKLGEYCEFFDALFDFRTKQHLAGLLQDKYPYELLLEDVTRERCGNVTWFTFIDNHDLPRLVEKIEFNRPLFETALKILFILPGVPTLLYGTESMLGNDVSLELTDFDRGRSTMKFSGELSPLIQELSRLRRDLMPYRKIRFSTKRPLMSIYVEGEKKEALLFVNLSKTPSFNSFNLKEFGIEGVGFYRSGEVLAGELVKLFLEGSSSKLFVRDLSQKLVKTNLVDNIKHGSKEKRKEVVAESK